MRRFQDGPKKVSIFFRFVKRMVTFKTPSDRLHSGSIPFMLREKTSGWARGWQKGADDGSYSQLCGWMIAWPNWPWSCLVLSRELRVENYTAHCKSLQRYTSYGSVKSEKSTCSCMLQVASAPSASLMLSYRDGALAGRFEVNLNRSTPRLKCSGKAWGCSRFHHLLFFRINLSRSLLQAYNKKCFQKIVFYL
jgi:hypothetical protein